MKLKKSYWWFNLNFRPSYLENILKWIVYFLQNEIDIIQRISVN